MKQKKPQSQASLTDQLNELEKLAIENGLYDAHDWIINHRANGNIRIKNVKT